MRLGIVLFNLGGPDAPEAVRPFLTKLFSDPAIIALPAPFRLPLAWFIAARRAPFARDIYAKIGGRSPILEQTEAQARALDAALSARGHETKSVIAMRYWKPFAGEAIAQLKAFAPERVVLAPLYPQFSTTTTASSAKDFVLEAIAARLTAPLSRICCYPRDKGFIAAEIRLVREALARRKAGVEYRVLFSAHGLPKRVVERGDPYRWQVEQTVAAIVAGLGDGIDHSICYQSRVGPLEWIGPSADDEIRRAGAEGKGVIVVPVAFVSEHSETLVELDIEYRHLAESAGVADYIRVPTVTTAPEFIAGLADLVEAAAKTSASVTDAAGRICPAGLGRCGYKA